uniref:C2H2-type domain-containing protein n=1 Tax=Oncorhynchus tshawytscha TaxID=74940 RepID=A0AAZ3RPA3_ONCTS
PSPSAFYRWCSCGARTELVRPPPPCRSPLVTTLLVAPYCWVSRGFCAAGRLQENNRAEWSCERRTRGWRFDVINGRCLSSGHPQPHVADETEKSLSRSEHLKKHQQRCTGKKPHHCCSDCGKSFTNRSDFIIHQRIHTGEKPYCCSQCGKSFAASNTLKSHLRIHTGEKPYPCLDCGKSFSYLGALNIHKLTHTGVKPYSCDQCGKSYAVSDA